MPFKINIYQSRQKYYVHRSYAPHERGDFIQTMKTSHGGNLSDRKNIVSICLKLTESFSFMWWYYELYRLEM